MMVPLNVWMEMLEDYHENGRIILVLILLLKFLIIIEFKTAH